MNNFGDRIRGFAELKKLIEDESGAGRIEIVNPTYAQSDLFQSVELDGRTAEEVQPEDGEAGTRRIRLSMPRLGIRTLRFSNLLARKGY